MTADNAPPSAPTIADAYRAVNAPPTAEEQKGFLARLLGPKAPPGRGASIGQPTMMRPATAEDWAGFVKTFCSPVEPRQPAPFGCDLWALQPDTLRQLAADLARTNPDLATAVQRHLRERDDRQRAVLTLG
jgi:hypothetical protein